MLSEDKREETFARAATKKTTKEQIFEVLKIAFKGKYCFLTIPVLCIFTFDVLKLFIESSDIVIKLAKSLF